tara:strand:+ start:1223 stop:3106 length:1884 start_codon:yes stop_codon:yes gene_type:complete
LTLRLVEIQPGVVKDITDYSAGKNGPFYVDSNLVRFKNGFPQKLGGWQQESYFYSVAPSTSVLVQGTPKKSIFWRGFDSIDRIAIGTTTHLYLIKENILHDITPLRKTSSSLSNPLTTANGDATVTVADTGHGAETGDFIVIENASAIGGISADNLNRPEGYQITKLNNNSYTFEAPVNASSTVSGGGGTLNIKYLIGKADNMGVESADPATGWGVGAWNEGTWNTPRTVASNSLVFDATRWSLNLWGDDLLANNRNGQLYYWSRASGEGTRAVLVSSLAGASGVPTQNRMTSVSFPDRHFISAGSVNASTGTFDPMLVRFSDQEDFTNFTVTATNTAGDQRLEVGSKIISITPSKDETLIQTDEAIYGMTFVGPPFTFSFRLLAVNCGAVSQEGTLVVDAKAYWIGKSNFFLYNGAVQELPCPVKHFVFDRINNDRLDKTHVGHNKKFNEITWFYVSTSNTATSNPEPDSYVTYNYLENVWTIGELDRNTWTDAKGFKTTPFAFDKDGRLYNHEVGNNADGEAMNCHIESAEIEIDADGTRQFLIDRIIPDANMSVGTSLSVEFKTRKYPNATEITKGPFPVVHNTEKISTRVKGRQIAIKYSSSGIDDEWALGDFRINAQADSVR